MTDFANASLIQRRQMLEDALVEVLRPIGDITHNEEKDRCLAVTVRRCEGHVEQELHSLWSLACRLEALL